ncbi:MAG: acyP [Cyanobacteria bacterium RYN_339]|nr:acyP [Cyanobacteria bacterium RYN_339]
MQRVHLYVSGRVQGVFYRASTEAVATPLHLTGWVRNLHDGRVEVVAEGPQEALDRLVQWCHRGPDAAQVAGVDVTWSDATGEFGGFEQRR